jgi:hypothetical protein
VAAGVLHVLVDELIGQIIWFQLCDIALQLSIVCVDRVDSQSSLFLLFILTALFLNLKVALDVEQIRD